MSEERDLRLAVLIDADNAPRSALGDVMAEVAVYGTPTIKRIYGDWTTPNLASWKPLLLENAITPVQQYGYTTGKNSTDSAMIIDAMDILYTGQVDGFVLVSSDSDFTRLAIRLREAGKKVYGMGEKKTPTPFIAACNKFKYLEILERPASPEIPACSTASAGTDQMTRLATVRDAIMTIIDETSDEDGWVSTSEIGNRLNKRYPDFDVRNFGYRKLTPFLKSLGILEIKALHNPDGSSRLVRVRLKG